MSENPSALSRFVVVVHHRGMYFDQPTSANFHVKLFGKCH
uniref:Uncharacterized protein n=1 Tax=Arundo donax TaxID=35708 RepID=A0A0A9EHA6_ARUDO